jgi:hypothetical protein
MMRLRVVAAAIALALAPVSAVAQRGPAAADDYARQSQSQPQLMANIERKHPTAFYALAKRLFEAGQRDEAVSYRREFRPEML